MPGGRVEGAVHAEPVALARADAGQIAVVTKPSTSDSRTRCSAPASSNRHSSTLSATSEKSVKLVPAPS
jgi:hypothetical protein